MLIRKAILLVIVIGLCTSVGFAQEKEKEEEVQEIYRAFGVSMTQGISGGICLPLTLG